MVPFLPLAHQAIIPKLQQAQRGSSFIPTAGLVVIAALAAFSPWLEGGTTHHAVMIIRFTILLALTAYLANAIRCRAFVLPHMGIGPPLACFLALAVFSTLFSAYTHQSFQWLLVILGYAALLFLLACFIERWHHVIGLLAVLCVVGLLEAGWALLEAAWLREPRPNGTFFNPNFLAGYLAAVLTIIVGVVCYAPRAVVRRIKTRRAYRGYLVAAVVLMALFLATIASTGSRGAAIALVGGIAVVVGVRFRWKAAGILTGLLLLAVLVPNPVRDRFSQEYVSNPVGYARWHIWESSLRALADRPSGIGLGLYQYVFPRYMFPVEGQIMQYGRVAHTAHNEFLQMGVELGVASIPVVLWGVVLVAREARRGLHQRLRWWQRGLLVGVSGAAAAILVHACVDSNLRSPAIAIVLILCLGILLSARRLSGSAHGSFRSIPLGAPVACAIVGALVLGGLAVEVAKLGGGWMAFEAGGRAMEQEEYQEAVMLYQKAVRWTPGKALYHSSLAAAHFKVFEHSLQGDAALAALGELQEAIALNPLDGRLQGLLGYVYVSLALAPKTAMAGAGLQRRQQAARLRRAHTAYERALELEPFSAFHRLELGKVRLRLGDRVGGTAVIQEAVAIEPNFLLARAWLVDLYLGSDQTESAQREYREILARWKRYARWPKTSMETP